MMLKIRGIVAAVLALLPLSAFGHDWHNHAPHKSESRQNTSNSTKIRLPAETRLNISTTRKIYFTNYIARPNQNAAEIAQYFNKFKNVKTRSDSNQLYIECNAIPDHPMMIGIRNWQQQVPLPQPFTGNNAWTLPLRPKLSDNPISVRKNPMRGAIAIAVNGVPIFCALNNRGEDAYKLGELDKWGGHCGRGDDYHYHIAPVHLEEVVGKGNPIAFALDGFPIYGYTESDGSPVGKLDQYNGQFDANGKYHYHATKTFPYVNGGLRGEVTLRGDQVEQPKDSPVRPGMPPLRGAQITDIKTKGEVRELTYTLNGRRAKIVYQPTSANGWKFTYTEANGSVRTENYERRAARDNGRRGGPPPRGRGGPPPRGGDRNGPPRI
ncbi:MAG: YHYH protein [Planctomycetota bacterium]